MEPVAFVDIGFLFDSDRTIVDRNLKFFKISGEGIVVFGQTGRHGEIPIGVIHESIVADHVFIYELLLNTVGGKYLTQPCGSCEDLDIEFRWERLHKGRDLYGIALT